MQTQWDIAPGYLVENRVQADTPGASWPEGRDWFVAYQLALREAAGDIVVNTRTALTYSVVWRCINYIASAIASLDWHVYDQSEDGRKRVSIHDNIAWTLQMQANPEMSALDWRQVMLRDALLWGNGISEIERNGAGKPIWLWRIDPARVLLDRDPQTQRLVYRVRTPDGINDEFLDPSNVFHLKGLSPDGLVGYSPVAVARRAIELGLQQELYGVGYFRRGPTPGGFLKAPGAMKEEERRSMSKSFSERHGGARNSGSVPVLSGGMEFVAFSMPNKDAEWIDGRNLQGEEICRIYGVPQHIAGFLRNSTNNNIEHQGIEAVQYCLSPWCARLQVEADIKLFGRVHQGRRRTKLDLRTLLRGDSATQASSLASQVTNGLRTVNEGRDELDLNAIEGGDTPLIQGAMKPLLAALNSPPAPGGPGGVTPAVTGVTPNVTPPELLGLSMMLQSFAYDCGAACVQIVAEFFEVGGDRSEDDYIVELKTSPLTGTQPNAILQWLNVAGLVTTSGSGMAVDDLRTAFAAGRPVIALIQSPEAAPSGSTAGHWVVVVGVGLGQVFFHDPATGRAMLAEADFDARWHDANTDGIPTDHFGIVVGDGFAEAKLPLTPDKDVIEGKPPVPATAGVATATVNALLVQRLLAEFDEDKVERDDHGRFASGGGNSEKEEHDQEQSRKSGESSTFDTVKEANVWAKSFAVTAGGISNQERESAQHFQKGGHKEINEALRDRGQTKGKTDSGIEQHIKNLDEVISRSTVNQKVTVERGISAPFDADKFQVGKGYIDHGFTSTTLSKETSELFTAFTGGVICEITVPKGSNGVYLKSTGDAELVLARGGAYNVTAKTTEKNEAGQTVTRVKMELVHQGIFTKLNDEARQKSIPPNRRAAKYSNETTILANADIAGDNSRFLWSDGDLEETDASALPTDLAKTFTALLTDAYARLLRVETDKAQRAANKGQDAYTRHIAAYYTPAGKHYVAEAVRPIIAALLLAMGKATGTAGNWATNLATDHAERSVKDLAKGTGALAAWESRPAEQAAKHLGMILEAVQ